MGLRFLAAVQEACDFIGETPGAGSHGHYEDQRLRELRRWSVPGFANNLVFYRLVDEVVEIVRVLHGARDIDALFDAE